MVTESRNFGDDKKYPPLTPPEPLNKQESDQIERDERRTFLEDVKLGAVASGAAGMPAVGMSVVDLAPHHQSEKLSSDAPEIMAKNELHLDPISGEPGAHPVGVGVGAATGGVAAGTVSGLAIGSVAGPVGAALGAAVGAAVGAVAGGFAGKGIAESMHPTVLDVEEYEMNTQEDKEDFKAAHAFGWNSRLEFSDETWESAEDHLRAEWESDNDYHIHRPWDEVKTIVKESWDQADSTRHV